MVLDSLAGRSLPDPLTTLGFNLILLTADGARVTSWEGGTPQVVDLAPGTHMVAHDYLDDPRTERVGAWLDAFAAAPTDTTSDSSRHPTGGLRGRDGGGARWAQPAMRWRMASVTRPGAFSGSQWSASASMNRNGPVQ